MAPMIRAFAGLALLAVAAAVAAATAEPIELDPELQAKIALEKIKQHGGKGKKGDGKCGQIDIANDKDDARGTRAAAPRDKTVIVTGPVINATTCR